MARRGYNKILKEKRPPCKIYNDSEIGVDMESGQVEGSNNKRWCVRA